MKLNVIPVNFQIGGYINQGIDLVKKDFGTMILTYFFTLVFSIIPFCGLLAMGNFIKICKKIDENKPVNAAEVFNFDNFGAYFLSQLYIVAAVFAIYIPFLFLIPFHDPSQEPNPVLMGLFIVYFLAIFIILILVTLKGFYMPALFSLKNMQDVKAAWKISSIMTKDNLLSIFLFSIVVGFLSQLGVFLCIIGIFLTMPFYYTSHYFAYKHGLKQIEFDELQEIGKE